MAVFNKTLSGGAYGSERVKRRGISKTAENVMLERSEPTVYARGVSLSIKPRG